jgi:hypothetical protein
MLARLERDYSSPPALVLSLCLSFSLSLSVITCIFENNHHCVTIRQVKDIFCLLAASRVGLTEDELLGVSGFTRLSFSPLFLATQEAFINRAGYAARFRKCGLIGLLIDHRLITFAHNHLREAVEKRYFSSPSESLYSFAFSTFSSLIHLISGSTTSASQTTSAISQVSVRGCLFFGLYLFSTKFSAQTVRERRMSCRGS